MMWVVQQNKLGAVNLMNVITIFIRRQDNMVVARIAPTGTAKDAVMSPYVELGKYRDLKEAKEVLNDILSFITDAVGGADDPVFRMPQEDDSL